MDIRALQPTDREAFTQLSDIVVEALENKDFLIPMSKEEADATFNDDSADVVLGGFINGKLVATLGMFYDIRDYESYLPDGHSKLKGAEIGEAMVHPELRRSGLINELWASLKVVIQNHQLDFLLATAHPENVSNHLMQKDDFTLVKVFNRRGYTRNMYLKRLSQQTYEEYCKMMAQQQEDDMDELCFEEMPEGQFVRGH